MTPVSEPKDEPEIIYECCECVPRLHANRSMAVFRRECPIHGQTWHRPMRKDERGGLEALYQLK